jgi:ADP-ribose pyrophosphatase
MPTSPDPLDTQPTQAREVSRDTLGEGKFLRLDLIHWRDAHGVDRKWESAERIGGVRAVLIIAWLIPSQRLLLIRQYRPPAKKFVVEFPAGLIDGGETPEQGAERELYEETGYRCRVLRTTEAAFNTPGLSSESVYQVIAEIDESDPANQSVTPHFDTGEQIETLLIPREGLAEFLGRSQAAGTALDAKVAAYLAGILAE